MEVVVGYGCNIFDISFPLDSSLGYSPQDAYRAAALTQQMTRFVSVSAVHMFGKLNFHMWLVILQVQRIPDRVWHKAVSQLGKIYRAGFGFHFHAAENEKRTLNIMNC